MSLKFCSFASGSSGNSYLVKNETTALLIDAGISGKKILEGLESTQTPLDQVKGLLITHEHIDHVKACPCSAKRYRIFLFTPTKARGEGSKNRSPRRSSAFSIQARIFT